MRKYEEDFFDRYVVKGWGVGD